MQNYGYRLGKNIKMKDNTLEHLFGFLPQRWNRQVKINFLKQRNTKQL